MCSPLNQILLNPSLGGERSAAAAPDPVRAAPFVALPTLVLITEDITIRDIAWIASLVHIVRTVGTAVGLWGRDRSWAEL